MLRRSLAFPCFEGLRKANRIDQSLTVSVNSDSILHISMHLITNITDLRMEQFLMFLYMTLLAYSQMVMMQELMIFNLLQSYEDEEKCYADTFYI